MLITWVGISEIRDPKYPTVLCIERLFFERDIEQLRARTRLNWITINYKIPERFQKAWLPRELREQALYVRHESKYLSERIKADKFFISFLESLLKRVKISAIMSANIDCWQDESLRNACLDLKIPFLVLCREHRVIPYKQQSLMEKYRSLDFKFTGAGVAVFGEVTRSALIDSGACSDKQVWVTGAPRFDIWRNIRNNAIPKDSILLLSYAGGQQYYAPDSFSKVLKLLAELSLDQKKLDAKFIVKCKTPRDKHNITKMLRNTNHSLVLTEAKPLPELLLRAKLIIGFNSLAFLEALWTDATLVFPILDNDSIDTDKLMLCPSDLRAKRILRFVNNIEQLRGLIETTLLKSESETQRAQKERRELFLDYFCNTNGRGYSDNVEEFVRRFAFLPS